MNSSAHLNAFGELPGSGLEVAPGFFARRATAAEILAIFDYDREAEQLRWAERPGSLFRHPKMAAKWNRLFAGKIVSQKTDGRGYLIIRIGKQTYQSHRIMWVLHHGEWPKEQIDHIDGNRKNNAIENLRDVSQCVNSRNNRMRQDNTSGVTGVHWCKSRGKWGAVIQHKGTITKLGYFSDKQVAVATRLAAQSELQFGPSHGAQKL